MDRSRSATHRQAVAVVPMRLSSGADGEAVLAAEFAYSTRDPYAVRATFSRERHAPVVWIFARDLLLVGAVRRAGVGDVRVHPSGDDVVLELTSPGGSAVLAATGAEIRRFNAQMLALVAPGDEGSYVDIDAELSAFERPIAAGGEA